VLFKLEQWRAAGEAYREVVRRDPKGKHTKEAAYAAVIALKNAMNPRADRSTPTRRKDPTKPRPIPRLERELIAAAETYLRLVPGAPERVPLLYRLARIYYEHDHHTEAIKRFEQIITTDPDHELASYAANLLLDCLNLLKRYQAMARQVERMLKMPRLAKGELLRTLNELWVSLERKRIEKLERAKKYRACGEGYLRMVARHPTHRWRDELLFNAAICFELAKLPRRAIAARVNLVTSTPASRLVPRTLAMLAENLQQQGDPGEAARYLEQLAHRFPAEREAPEALERAFALRMARQEHAKARADAERFLLRYSMRRRYKHDAARLAFALGEIHERGGNHAAVVKHYERWLARWGREGGPELRLRALLKRAGALWRGACPVKELDGTCARPARRPARTRGCGPGLLDPLRITGRRRRQARRAQGLLAGVSRQTGAPAAWAAFLEVQPRFEAFLALGALPRARRDLTRALERRRAQLGQALEAYRRVIARGAPGPTAAALARTAQLQLAFADQLLTNPVPRRVPRETYCEALDAHVDPLREAATKALKQCAGHKLGGPWPALCKRMLSRVSSRRTSSSSGTMRTARY
jgi:tetratricopeptide (TPR) repeat protein